MSDRGDQSDRRAGEALASQRESRADDDMDPALVARLEAWFSGPATSFPPPAGETATPGIPEPPEPEPEPQSKKALDAVDPGLLERLESQGARAAKLVEPLSPPAHTLDPSISRFDFAVWGLQGIGEPREVERPDDVQFAVQERTPQAILRDLHRPVRHYGDIYLRPVDLGIDRYGAHARAAIASLVYERRYHVDPKQEPNGHRALLESVAERRAILDRPWEESKPEQPRPVPSEFPDENDLIWFGSVGVDPDQ